MNSEQSTLITLIKSALTGEYYSLAENISLDKVFKIAVKHNVANMAYYGAINCGIDSAAIEMQWLFPYVCNRIAAGERQLYELNTLFKLFDENGIDYMPLKGTILKYIYPKPDMRTMGDADVLIRMEQYNKIEEIMKNQKFSFVKDNINEIVWNKNGILYLELHRYLVAPAHKDLFKLFGDGWKLSKLAESSNTRYEMSDEDTYLFLFVHFAKHYRAGGIGIRQAVDLWIYRKSKPKLDEEYLKKTLTKLKMYDFYKNTCGMLETWFEDKPSTEMSDFLTNYIYSSGNFGTSESYATAKVVRDSKTKGSIEKAFFTKVFGTIFLSYSAMCKKYPILIKLPILLPVMWVVRAFDVVFIKKKKISDYSIDAKAFDKVKNFEEKLKYVGLSFDFED